MEVIAQKAPYILKEAVFGLQEVDPRKKIEHQMALPIIGFPKHIEVRMWLTKINQSEQGI